MDYVFRVLLTLLCSFALGYVLRRFKIPGAMILGGMVGAAALNIITDRAYMPSEARFIAQAMAGGFLGCSITRSDLKHMNRILAPAVLALTCMTFSTIVIGFLISKLSPIDSTTALISGIAGGVNNIPLIAEDMGADVAKVALLQFVRLFVGIGIFPQIIKLASGESDESAETSALKKTAVKSRGLDSQSVIGLAAALLGGIIGDKTGIPAGILLFSMLAALLVRLIFDRGRLPGGLKPFGQLLTGSYIGCMLDRQDVLEMRFLVLPAIILVLVFVADCFLFGKLIQKFCGYSMRESMLACTPAGASEMVLISSELKVPSGRAADIAIIHVLRVILTVSLMPQIIPYIAKLF